MAYFKVEVVETFKYQMLVEADSVREAVEMTGDVDWGDPVIDGDYDFYVTELIEKLDDSDIDFDEDRVDVIGQNGNNGEHYE